MESIRNVDIDSEKEFPSLPRIGDLRSPTDRAPRVKLPATHALAKLESRKEVSTTRPAKRYLELSSDDDFSPVRPRRVELKSARKVVPARRDLTKSKKRCIDDVRSPKPGTSRQAAGSSPAKHYAVSSPQNVELKKTDVRIQCDLCPSNFAQKSSLKRHKLSCHLKRLLRCKKCHKDFTRINRLRNHCCGEDLKCEKCGTEYATMESLRRHRVVCKPCGRCNQVIVVSRKLHLQSCTGMVCKQCGIRYSTSWRLAEHEKRCNEIRQGKACSNCGKDFKRTREHLKHELTCGKHSCKTCCVVFSSPQELYDHKPCPLLTVQNTRKVHCRIDDCNQEFETKIALMRHRVETHLDPDQSMNFKVPYPWIDNNNVVDESMRETLTENRHFIFNTHEIDDIHSIFRFPLLNCESWFDELVRCCRIVQDSMISAIKVNITVGTLLRNHSGEYRYFAPGMNFPLLASPKIIHRKSEWNDLLSSISVDTISEHIRKSYPDTKTDLVLVCNAVIDVYSLDMNMGSSCVEPHIFNNKNIIALTQSRSGKKYDDNLCAVRALAYHKLSGNNPRSTTAPVIVTDAQLNTLTDQLSHRWSKTGLPLDEVENFENEFDIDIDIFDLSTDGCVIPVYQTQGIRGLNRLTLNLNGNHLSYVSIVPGYLLKFKCVGCDKVFKSSYRLKRHFGRCWLSTTKVFKRMHYKPSQSIFEKLEAERIIVEPSKRFYPWFATFDAEAALLPMPRQEGVTKVVKSHRLISVSISSNVDGYRDAQCFMGKTEDEIVAGMLAYLKTISDYVKEEAMTHWSLELDELDDRIIYREQECKPNQGIDIVTDDPTTGEVDDDIHIEELLVDDESVEKHPSQSNDELKRLKNLKGQFINYCSTLPVIGFNSSVYDINLMKTSILTGLGFGNSKVDWTLGKDEDSFVIRKNNSYPAIISNGLRFIDALSFLSAGVSYAKFLKAYDIKEQKSFFPYDYINSLERLDDESLPPYESFENELKGGNLLEQGGDENLGRNRYRELERLWKDNGWTSIRDYLRYYNNLDVNPMVEALMKMQSFYFGRGVDIFKIAISLPGVARKLLFETARDMGVSFSCIHPEDDDLFLKLKRGLVGGPSIIFSRDHGVGRTQLRGDVDHTCESIVGYDANALYTYCFDSELPCGGYVRRFAPDFKPDRRLFNQSMFDWLDFIAFKQGINIRHERNGGEVWVKSFKCDGYCFETKQAYEFDGCEFHGCVKCGKSLGDYAEKIKKTQQRRTVIESMTGNTVIHIQECDYKRSLTRRTQSDPPTEEYTFTQSRLPPFYRKNSFGSVSQEKILKAVKDDSLYGIIECDLHVPDNLISIFSEMSPLFGTSEIPFRDMGFFMQQHVRSHGLSEKPRKLLIGAMRAEKMLIHSKLLKWYLTHGLVVTKVHEVVEFTPVRCFRPFVKMVTEARRNGDANPSMQPIADTCKLIGNSAYGSIIMDKLKHTNTRYTDSYNNAQKMINNPRFRSVSRVRDGLYEICMAKTSINCDLPTQLGFAILQFAKLRMLEFYYDFLLTKCNPKKFELCEMDTDSMYMALSGPNIESIAIDEQTRKNMHDEIYVRNCNKLDYTPEQGHFFPRECCKNHNAFDNRTPGLFKLEAEGVEMICLSSKTYSLRTASGSCKFSSKGLNRRALLNPHDTMREVLTTGFSSAVVNKGFRVFNHRMFTYHQTRLGLSYFYCKRVILDDGVSTAPLPTVLRFWKSLDYIELVNEEHVLWPERKTDILIDEVIYPSLFDVCIEAGTRDDPEAFVVRAMKILPPYNTTKTLIFCAESKFVFRERTVNKCLVWTSGLSIRTSSLTNPEDFLGLNKLNCCFIESTL